MTDRPALTREQIVERCSFLRAIWPHSDDASRKIVGDITAIESMALASPPVAQAEPDDVVATCKSNSAVIKDYVASYEVRADEGDYTPNDRERFLIEDAINGLLADADFVRTFNAWQGAVRRKTPPPSHAQGVAAGHVRIKDIVNALESSAANTDTDPRWLAANELRKITQWETAAIRALHPQDVVCGIMDISPGFDYGNQTRHIPTVKVSFAADDWDSRDKFAKMLAAAQKGE